MEGPNLDEFSSCHAVCRCVALPRLLASRAGKYLPLLAQAGGLAANGAAVSIPRVLLWGR